MNQFRIFTQIIISLLMISFFVSTSCSDKEREEVVPISDVPDQVLAAAQDTLPGIKIIVAEIERTDQGVNYELAGTLDGKEYEIEITADGIIVEVEQEDDDDEDQDHDEDEDNNKDD